MNNLRVIKGGFDSSFNKLKRGSVLLYVGVRGGGETELPDLNISHELQKSPDFNPSVGATVDKSSCINEMTIPVQRTPQHP